MPGYRLNAQLSGEPVEARQLSIDLEACVETIEIGTPVDSHEEPADGTSDARSSGFVGATERAEEFSSLATTNSIEMKVRWEDVVNLDVNKTHSRMTFTYDGGCITNSSGSGYWWWRTGTFWTRTAYSATINRIPEGWCVPTPDNTKRSRYVHNYVDGTFKNGIFCAGFDTYVYYDNVSTYAAYNGNVSGWFDSTWVDEPVGCPPLHWVASFVP